MNNYKSYLLVFCLVFSLLGCSGLVEQMKQNKQERIDFETGMKNSTITESDLQHYSRFNGAVMAGHVTSTVTVLEGKSVNMSTWKIENFPMSSYSTFVTFVNGRFYGATSIMNLRSHRR